jgi:hypothetical protein
VPEVEALAQSTNQIKVLGCCISWMGLGDVGSRRMHGEWDDGRSDRARLEQGNQREHVTAALNCDGVRLVEQGDECWARHST